MVARGKGAWCMIKQTRIVRNVTSYSIEGGTAMCYAISWRVETCCVSLKFVKFIELAQDRWSRLLMIWLSCVLCLCDVCRACACERRKTCSWDLGLRNELTNGGSEILYTATSQRVLIFLTDSNYPRQSTEGGSSLIVQLCTSEMVWHLSYTLITPACYFGVGFYIILAAMSVTLIDQSNRRE
jgi:hypothetical protein